MQQQFIYCVLQIIVINVINEISRISITINRRHISKSNDALKKTSIIDSIRINITLLDYQTNTSNYVAKLNPHILGISLKGSSEKLKACFYSCCNLLILQQIYCDRYQSFQLIYLSGQINMAFSILMVKYTSFKASTVYVGVVILAKTLIQTYFEPFNPVYFISLILLSFSILMVSYINEKYRRLAFLHQFTNRQWESIIPTLIQNPFLLFTFDEERMIFRIKLFNDIQISDWGVKTDQSENLRYFLRTYYVGKETLEQYIVSKLKRTSVTQSELLEQKLKITKEDKYNDQQKQIAITFSQFELSETVFMIVFDQNEERVKGLEKIKNALIQGINQHQELTLNFIKKQLALINQSINLNPGIDFLYKLKLHCLYFQGRFTQCNSFQDIEEDVKFFSLKFLIKEVVHIYEMAFPQQKFEITFSETHEYQMFSNLKLVQIYILTIFQSLYRQQNQPVIYIHIKELNQEIKKIQILITCYDSYDIVKQLLTNQIFYKIQTRICPSTKIKVKNEAIMFILYQDLEQLNQIRLLQEEIE
ncbi:hypothetical protein pb186bvf_013183 [Paramecium bursaria]